RAPLEDVPRLVLLVVELEAQRVVGADEEELADVRLGAGPQELPAPRLLRPLRLERERLQAAQVRRAQLPVVHRPTLPASSGSTGRLRRTPGKARRPDNGTASGASADPASLGRAQTRDLPHRRAGASHAGSAAICASARRRS